MLFFYFLCEVIFGAGAVREGAVPSLKAHSIREVSTSAVLMQNWSVSKVLEAASWSLNSVFASFYLRDIQYVFQGLHSLIPIVATGSVLH